MSDYSVVAKVRERPAVNKERSHRFHMERFSLKNRTDRQTTLPLCHRSNREPYTNKHTIGATTKTH
jgi:hypothetical protein